jgi:protein-S-isoprenylcysteine O-methyltransferase Ste14
VTQHQLDLLATIGLAVCWGTFLLAWLAGAIFYESRAPVTRTRSTLGSTALIGVVLVTVISLALPRADWRSLAVHPPWIRILGLVVLLIATAFTVWARVVLGTMWSAVPAVKQEHQLRTTGPYAITRHPIYTGILGMLLGSLLLAGGRWVIAFGVFLVLLEIKLRVEEKLMLAEFPDEYPRYRQRVPQLVPGLRLPGRRRLADGG